MFRKNKISEEQQQLKKQAELNVAEVAAADHANDTDFNYAQGISNSIGNIYKILETMGSQKEVILQISDDLQGVAAFVQSLSERLKNISVAKTKDGKTTDLGDVTAALADCTERASILMRAVGQENKGFKDFYKNFKNILYQVECLLTSVHVVLGKVEKLNIGELSKSLPATTGEFEAKIEGMLSSVVEKIIPPSLLEELLKLKDYMISVDSTDIDKFKKLSIAEQNIILVALEGANHGVKSVVIKCDEIESKLSFKEGSILKEIPIGVNFNNNPVLAKFSVTSRTLDDVFKQISTAYSLRLDAIKHRNKPRMFPFTDALLQARIDLKVKLCDELVEYTNDTNKKISDRMRKHLIRVVEAASKENAKTKGNENAKRKIFLGELLESPPISNDELAKLKQEIVNKHELSLDDKLVKKVVEEVTVALKSSCSYVENQSQLRQDLIKSVQSKIESATRELGPSFVVVEAKNDNSGNEPTLIENAIEIAMQSYAELKAFVGSAKVHRHSHPADTSTKKPVEAAEPMLMKLKKANGRLQKAIQQMLDPEVYQAYFVLSKKEKKSHLVIPGVMPWVGDIGKGVKSATRALNKLEQIVNKLNGTDQSRVNKLPSAAMSEVASLVREFISIMGEMGLAIESIAANPSFHDMQSAILNWRTTIDRYVESLKEDNHIEGNEWLGFDISRGLSRLSMQETNNAVITSIDATRSVYAYLGEKFGHGIKQRQDVDMSFVKIRKIMVDKYKALDDDPTKMDYLRFMIKHFKEILAILPHAGQIKNALTNGSVEEGLQLLARLNGFLKSIMLMADEVESALCLRKGYISRKLLSFDVIEKDANGLDVTVKKSLDTYCNELIAVLKANDYAFPSDDTFPYVAAMNANRKATLAKLKKESVDLQAERDVLLATKKRHEVRVIGNVQEQDGDIQLLQLKIKALHEGYEKGLDALAKKTEERLAAYELLPGQTAEEKAARKANHIHADIFVLYRMINDDVLPRLNKNMDFNLSRLKPLLEIKKPTNDETEEIEKIKVRIAALQKVLEHWRILLKSFPSGMAFEGGKGKGKVVAFDPAVKKLKHAFDTKEKELFTLSTELKLAERNKQTRLKIVRLQQLEDMEELTHNENHELIGLRAFKCGLKATYQENEQELHINAAKKANVELRAMVVANRITKSPAVVSAQQVVGKVAILNRIEIEIQKMNKKRFSTSTLFGSSERLDASRCVDGLKYISQHYQRDGYTLLNAKRDLMGNDEDLYTVVMKHYLPLFINLIKMDDKIAKDVRGQMIIKGIHLQKPVAIKMDINVIDKLQQRIDTLTVEYNKKRFFKRIQHDKIALLTSVSNHMQSHNLADALSMVREKNLGTFHLLFEGRTGDMFKQIERESMTKDDAKRMITAEITRLGLKKSGLRFFVKSRGKVLEHHIEALEALRDSKELTAGQLKLLQSHDKELLLDCQKVLGSKKQRDSVKPVTPARGA